MIAGDQPGQCFHAALRIQRVDLGISAVVRHIFLDQQVAVSQCGNLCRITFNTINQYMVRIYIRI